MGNYDNDQPITGEKEKPDLLNRSAFAENLASVLQVKPREDCMTVSLEGDWGYGKTSVINLIKKSLKECEAPIVLVEYNPWLAGKAEALVQDFLVQFSSQLNIPDRPKDGLKAAEEVLAYSELFNVMKFIPGVEPWASTVKSVLNAFGGTTEKISKLKELDLIGRKNKIHKIINSLGVSIVVIIDDIDRLTPDEAFQVVRLVKAVADFPGTSFLLSFDPSYLASSLEKHGIENASQYIDKVVQLRIPLPLISHHDFQKLADIELKSLSEKSLTDSFENDQDRLVFLYHTYVKYLIRSPRDLKRIFNHLRFVLTQIKGEVCFTDLYCLSVLAIKSQDVYRSLKDSPEYYVGRRLYDSFTYDKPEEVVENARYAREVLIGKVPSKDSLYVDGILKELFPLLGDPGYSVYGSNYDHCGRVASEKRLYIATHYQVPANYASDTDVKQFLNGNIERDGYLKRAIKEDFVERLFELLNIYFDKIDDNDSVRSLHAIYNSLLNSEYLKKFEEAVFGAFSFEPYRNIIWLTLGYLEKTDKKREFLFGLLGFDQFIPISGDLCHRVLVQQGKIKNNDSHQIKEKWLSAEESVDFVEQWSSMVEESLINGPLIDSIHVSRTYYVLCNSAPDKVKSIFSRWIQEKNGVEKIAKLIGRCGSDSTNGPYSQISKESISDFLDYEALVKLVESELNCSDKEIPAYFKAIYLSIKTGDKYYLNDCSKGDKF